MTAKSNEQITSGNVLGWAKRVETQRVQAAVMSAITKFKEFDRKKCPDQHGQATQECQ